MSVGMIIILRDEERINEILSQEREILKRESELMENWKENMLAIGTFYTYRLADSIGSFHLKSLKDIEKSLKRDGLIVFINKNQRS